MPLCFTPSFITPLLRLFATSIWALLSPQKPYASAEVLSLKDRKVFAAHRHSHNPKVRHGSADRRASRDGLISGKDTCHGGSCPPLSPFLPARIHIAAS